MDLILEVDPLTFVDSGLDPTRIAIALDLIKLNTVVAAKGPGSSQPPLSLLIEGKLCMIGADANTWGTTWAKVFSHSFKTNSLPSLSDLFRDEFTPDAVKTEESHACVHGFMCSVLADLQVKCDQRSVCDP